MALVECKWCGGEGFTRAEDGPCPVCRGVGKIRELTVGAVMNAQVEAKPMKKWIGVDPTECDICHRKIRREFVDGATRLGPWGILCPGCFVVVGVGIGPGMGQRYVRDEPGEPYYKVEG